MKVLSTEHLLLIADEFCPVAKVQVRSFAALAGCAAVPGARVHGIYVHDTVEAAATALGQAIVALQPLTGRNRDFAHIASAVYRGLAQEG